MLISDIKTAVKSPIYSTGQTVSRPPQNSEEEVEASFPRNIK
jgi:hypothetical protein